MKQLWDDAVAMLKAPFVGQLDIIRLFLLVGLVLIFALAWGFVLNHIKIAGTIEA